MTYSRNHDLIFVEEDFKYVHMDAIHTLHLKPYLKINLKLTCEIQYEKNDDEFNFTR